MKEIPISFRSPMVRAILDGSKVQTRRLLDPQPSMCVPSTFAKIVGSFVQFREVRQRGEFGFETGGPIHDEIKLKFKIGDRLWVRETFRTGSFGKHGAGRVQYRADEENISDSQPWKPFIHMRRWASRITLEVTNVRVERLRDILENDARKEGFEACRASDGYDIDPFQDLSAVENFARTWDSIYAAKGLGWKENPFAWVIEFKHVERK